MKVHDGFRSAIALWRPFETEDETLRLISIAYALPAAEIKNEVNLCALSCSMEARRRIGCRCDQGLDDEPFPA